MSFNVNDVVFGPGGRPGVVVGRNDLQGSLVVEKDGPKYEEARKRGFINGLAVDERQKFNEILDHVRQIKEPEKRVVELQTQMEKLKEDPRNNSLVRYLNAELAHLMYSERITPREYSIDSTKL